MIFSKQPKSLLVLMTIVLSNTQSIAASDAYWTKIPETEKKTIAATLDLMPDRYSIYMLNLQKIRRQLDCITSGGIENTLNIPFPDGQTVKVEITEKSTMAPGLSAKFPEIKTFQAKIPERPLVSGVVGIDAQYFHAMLFVEDGRRAFIDHRTTTKSTYYISYYDSDYHPSDKKNTPHNIELEK